jgi:hypothetical protein
MGLGAALVFALALLVLAPSAAATNDPPGTGGPVYGDWTVTDARSYDSVTIWLEYGNLSVSAGGSLTLTNVQLRFNSSEDGLYGLTVAAGGAMNVWNGTHITSNRTTVHYNFVVRGALDMNNANASEMWGSNTSWTGGIQIYSNNVFINNSQIFYGRTGGITVFDCSPTITNNTIRENGQDGGSQQYCFGMYIRNSKGTIYKNTVNNNGYSTLVRSRFTSSISSSPSGGSGYVELDGKYYYGWYGYGYYNGYYSYYCYRYEYNYTYWYNTTAHYGFGVWIVDSDLTLESNTIMKNGWGPAPGYSYQYMYNQIYYHTSVGPYSIYGYWHLYMTYQYKYDYTYKNVYCYGDGLHVENSKLVLEKNTVDQNAFLAKHDAYPSTDANGYYSGVDVNLYDCKAVIANNTFSSAAILLNLTRCTVKIEANKLLGDYIGGGSYYSTSFIPWRVAYGIRYYQSMGDITNNTIDFKFKDYPMYIGGQNLYFAELVTAVDFPGAKDTTFAGNKVTIDSQYYGMVRCLLFNTSLKATNLKIQNCQFELKYTSVTSSVKPVMPQVIISLKSEALIENCVFKGPASGNYMAPIWGIQVGYGTVLTVRDSPFSNYDRALVVTDYSTLTATGVTITGIRETGVQVDYLSRANLTGCKISGNARSIMASKSVVDVYECTLASGVEFYMDQGATINVYNSAHTKAAFQAFDNASRLNVMWPITLQVVWQNGVPVKGAEVTLSTIAGSRVYSGTTNETGFPAGIIWIKEYIVQNMTLYMYNPHRITGSKGRTTSLDMFIIDKALNIEFQLVDTIPPALVVDYPFDGQNLNRSLVELRGTAPDPEAGLVGSVIEINIDNTGWAQVSVNETDWAWNYARMLGDGLHVIRLKAVDEAGNVARLSLSVFVDTSGPVLRVFSPVEGCYTSQRTVQVMGVSEEGAFVTVNGVVVNLQNRYFSVRVSLEDGPNTINVVASDSAGNTRIADIHVWLDSQPPLLEIGSPQNGQYTNQDPLSVKGTSEPSAVVTVNGVRAYMTENTFETLVGLSEGANTVIVTATDPAGNTATRTLLVYLDTAPPEITLFSPRNGLWTNQSRVLVSGATEQGAAVTINGQNTPVISTLFNGYWTMLEGANRIEVSARDQAGNTQSLVRTVYLDTRLPDLVVTKPGDRAILGSRVVDIVGSVDFGTEVRINGELVPVVDFVFATTVSYGEDGTKVIEISARDRAGNMALAALTVVVDTTSPAIVLSYPTDGLTTKQRMITVSGQTEAYATVIVNTGMMLVTGRDGLFQVPVVLEDGENRVTVRAIDSAGNAETQSVTVMRPAAKAAVKEDLSWALNLTGLLLGMGIAVPLMSAALTGSWRRRREAVLAEVAAAEQARREREAEEARRAALPKVEKMGKKRAKPAEAPREEKAPEVLPEAPKAEAGAPDAAKAGLKDKSGATEVSPDEIDQDTRMKPKVEEPAAGDEKGAEAESSLKDKGGEAEGEAGETEGSGIRKKK